MYLPNPSIPMLIRILNGGYREGREPGTEGPEKKGAKVINSRGLKEQLPDRPKSMTILKSKANRELFRRVHRFRKCLKVLANSNENLKQKAKRRIRNTFEKLMRENKPFQCNVVGFLIDS